MCFARSLGSGYTEARPENLIFLIKIKDIVCQYICMLCTVNKKKNNLESKLLSLQRANKKKPLLLHNMCVQIILIKVNYVIIQV